MKQIGIKDWPKGLDFPLLMIPDALTLSLGLTYEAYEEEGLGRHFAAIVDVDGGPFLVSRGVHYPGEGTQIWSMEDGQSVLEKIEAFLAAFELDAEVIRWRSPLELADHRFS